MTEATLEPILRWMRLRKVVNEIPFGSTVLDIGCGRSAAFLNAISSKIQAGTGIDFKVESSKVQHIQTLQLRLDQALPFEDESFDIVTMLAVLEHLEHESQILTEIHRVLKKSGKLVLTVPSVWAQPVLEFLAFKIGIVDADEIRDHKRYYNREQLQTVLTKTVCFNTFKHHYFQFWMNNFCVATK
jgi:ubiquinone/menaquinone biosynthesis C-methylase UbiE